MKSPTMCFGLLAVTISAILVAGAKTPTPLPLESPHSSASATPPPAQTSTPIPLASPSDQRIAAIQIKPTSAGPPPKPVLYLVGTEPFSTGGKNFIRLRYDVFNKAEYPAEMFAAAPSLPPCGLNTNASRTWVDFFDVGGHRIYGFCALGKPEDLGKIWIAYEEGTIPPSYVYIELNDRQTNTKYKSNLADTTL